MLALLTTTLSLTTSAKLTRQFGPELTKKAATGASTVKMPTDHLVEVFNMLDSDGSGYLDERELGAAFEKLGRPADRATIHHSFTILDKNHDGMVSLEEFRAVAEQNIVPSLADMVMRDNNHVFEENGDVFADATYIRDEKLARADTKAWCADRCLATGHCEVLEDFYDMSASQVMTFCENCAGEDECDLV
jgi:hypothetical protein